LAQSLQWDALLRVGLRAHGLTPSAFWALTPFEARLMFGDAAAQALGRNELDELMARFPDAQGGDDA
jgi:uncharacterized phage protein (TIGR02216 family)